MQELATTNGNDLTGRATARNNISDASRRAYLTGQLEWPEIHPPSLDAFDRHLRSLQLTALDLERHAADVFLALACGQGDPEALLALSTRYFPPIDGYLVRSGFDRTTCKDVFQQALLHLCTGEAPRILTYGGRASLASWLRIAVHRFALQLVRQSDAHVANDLSIEMLTAGDIDVESRVTIEKARPRFELALQRALTELGDRERTLLRLCFLDGLSIDDIGTLYRVHRATAARWIQSIRQDLFERVQASLQLELGLRNSEFKSLAILLQSGIHLSLRRVLGIA
ncbi:MAG TPA: sigma-70 family RNA polymerase sigma factor [Polyangiaceae bacterium]